MAYSGFGLSVSGSISVSASGSAGTKPSGGACDGGNWWKCAGLVTYFTAADGGGHAKLDILKSGSWDKVQLAVVDGLESLGMLKSTFGWANVKNQVRAMAFFMNRARASGKNMDFDDANNRLTTTAAYAYDKALEEEQEDKDFAAAAAKMASSTMSMKMLVAPKPKKLDVNAIYNALKSVPPPKPVIHAAAQLATEPKPGMSTTTMVLIGVVGLAAAGGGYYFLTKKKRAA